jgi:hypothetical protein
MLPSGGSHPNGFAASSYRISQALCGVRLSDSFEVRDDTMARQIGSAYESFAENVVEAELSEG